MNALRNVDSYRSSEEEPPADQYGDAESRFSARESFRRPSGLNGRGVGFPWRTAFVAFFLVALGLSFVIAGGNHFWHRDRGAAAAFLSVGSVALVPGVYATFMLIQSLRGVPGFELHEGTYTRIDLRASAQRSIR